MRALWEWRVFQPRHRRPRLHLLPTPYPLPPRSQEPSQAEPALKHARQRTGAEERRTGPFLSRLPPRQIRASHHAETPRKATRASSETQLCGRPWRTAQAHAGSRKVTRPCVRLRPAPRQGFFTPSPPQRAKTVSATCEAGKAGDAFRDREPLQIGGELHLHDAGHDLQNHGDWRRPRLGDPATLGPAAAPAPRAKAAGERAGETPAPIGHDARRARARPPERAGLRTPGRRELWPASWRAVPQRPPGPRVVPKRSGPLRTHRARGKGRRTEASELDASTRSAVRCEFEPSLGN